MPKGRTPGAPSNVHTTYNRIKYGTETVGLTQAPIVEPADGVACFEVLVVADPQNAGTVYVGDELDGCHIPLTAGASVVLAINHTDKVHARASVADQTVHIAAAVESA